MFAKHVAIGFALSVACAAGAGVGCGGGDGGTLVGQPGAYAGHPISGGGSGVDPNHSGGTGPNVGNPQGTPTPTGARGYFLTTAYPALSTSPGNDATGTPILPCTTCHATGAYGAPTWLAGADGAGAYATVTSSAYSGLVAIPNNSLIILHGAHTGPALTSAQAAIVTQWLTMEAQERNLPTTPPKTLLSELQRIGKCMQLTDFTAQTANGTAASDIYRATARYQGNNVECQRCHNVGDGGFYANGNTTQMLTQTQSDVVFIKKYFTGTVDANGNFQSLTASGAISQKVDLTKVCFNQAACHPPIQLQTSGPESDVLVAIDTFVQTTLTRYSNGQCP